MPKVKNFCRVLLFASITLLIAAPAFAQGDLLWANTFGGTGDDVSEAITVDALGNIIIAGTFAGELSFGGPLVTSTNGTKDVFLTKYDRSGNHLWSKAIGGPNVESALGVAVDGLGNITIAGWFAGTSDFGGGEITSIGFIDIFLAQYDDAGNHLWSKTFGGDSSDQAWGIAVDDIGNITITGFFHEMVDFGGGSIISAGEADIFLAQFDRAGNHIWSRGLGGPSSDLGKAIAVDRLGNIAITGELRGIVDFGGGPIAPVGAIDGFVAEYDSMGNHIWSRGLGGVDIDAGEDVIMDRLGNVIVTGQFKGSVDFGGGSISSAGGADIFIVEYDNTGNHIRSRAIGGSGSDVPFGLAIDAVDNIVITGWFSNSVNFGGGVISSTNGLDIFVAQYDNDRKHIWSRGMGGPDIDLGRAVAIGPLGDINVTGSYRNSIDFGQGSIAPTGGWDSFVVQFSGDPLVAAAASTDSSGGGGCFIASATYGTPMAGEIDALRAVRDAYLLDSVLGSAFVDTYYRLSPPIADAVSRSPVLQSLVRMVLTPIVMVSKGILATPVLALVTLVLMLTLFMTWYAFPRRRTCRSV